ncbi:hypothetical protein [Ruegeria sp. THAF33]|uniref:hypothetical protein n=1 Tax=Ruegeria sp. THAF33 TaxID=2587853 RepID=UPI0020C770E7|nr:hypothetical protein [Ruegeria sp. THAF33]
MEAGKSRIYDIRWYQNKKMKERMELALLTEERPYPGTHADVFQIMDLAISYRDAAEVLFDRAKKGQPLSYAPARLCSIHAIELFLNAFLRHTGTEASQIRARVHNLADDAFVTTLRLRKKPPATLWR